MCVTGNTGGDDHDISVCNGLGHIIAYHMSHVHITKHVRCRLQVEGCASRGDDRNCVGGDGIRCWEREGNRDENESRRTDRWEGDEHTVT